MSEELKRAEERLKRTQAEIDERTTRAAEINAENESMQEQELQGYRQIGARLKAHVAVTGNVMASALKLMENNVKRSFNQGREIRNAERLIHDLDLRLRNAEERIEELEKRS